MSESPSADLIRLLREHIEAMRDAPVRYLRDWADCLKLVDQVADALASAPRPQRETERIVVLERAIGNCYMMARRQIAAHLNGKSSPDKDLERWQHVQRFCETTGSKSSILRGQLPTEITEGSDADPRAVPLETPPTKECPRCKSKQVRLVPELFGAPPAWYCDDCKELWRTAPTRVYDAAPPSSVGASSTTTTKNEDVDPRQSSLGESEGQDLRARPETAPDDVIDWSVAPNTPEAKKIAVYLTPTAKRLAEIAALPKGWDTYGADPIGPAVIARVAAFLRDVSIVPGSDGSVQLEWHAKGYDLVVVFNDDGTTEIDATPDPPGVDGGASGDAPGESDPSKPKASCSSCQAEKARADAAEAALHREGLDRCAHHANEALVLVCPECFESDKTAAANERAERAEADRETLRTALTGVLAQLRRALAPARQDGPTND